MPSYMSPRRRFLAAIHGGRVDRPPVGTVTSLATLEAMDACGAAFPDVHLDADRMVRLAEYSSLETGFDMIFPLFSVVHEAAALGAPVHWGARNVMPTISAPLWQEPEQIVVPSDFEQRPPMAVALESLTRLRRAHGDRYAIVGKTFGPWSLAFHMFGVEQVLMMTLDDPDKVDRIFSALLEVSVRSAIAQFRAGADVLCLGDHCSRDMCSPETYRRFLFPQHVELSRRVPGPLVLHTCGDTRDRIADFARTTLDCFHYDTKVPAAEAVRLAGGRISLMGGVSNVASLLDGDPEKIRADVQAALRAGVNIIGPECAIPLNTRLSALKAISPAVEELAGT